VNDLVFSSVWLFALEGPLPKIIPKIMKIVAAALSIKCSQIEFQSPLNPHRPPIRRLENS